MGNVVEYEEVVTENRYDGSGQRIRREENGRETRFYYMGSGLLYTTAGDRTLVTENILGLNGGIIGSKRFSDPYGTPEEEYANRYYFYHYDIRGSVTNIVGDDGKLVKGYEYDEYGNTTDGGEESFINEVTFTGSVRDLGSGLQYMNARYYDPATGRFVSQDTYTGTPYAPWTQHLYSYCGNNPVNMVDPTGHMPIQPMAVNDGGTTRVVPEPQESGEDEPWWNRTVSGSFQEGIIRGSGSYSTGYSEANFRLQINEKINEENSGAKGMLGGFAKLSGINANGRIGIGNDDVSLSLKGVADALTLTGQAGLQYQDGLGLSLKAKASLLSGRATTELNLWGWEIELGVTGDLGSIGAELTAGYFHGEGFKLKAGISALIGGGFILRIKPPA